MTYFKYIIYIIVIIIGINKISGKRTRIVNGVNARLGEIPYQVSIQGINIGHFCGGVILNKYFIITAAHCAKYLPIEMIVIITGTINFEEINRIYNVIQVHVHDEFQLTDQVQSSTYKFLNDIALMKVDSAIKFDYTTNFISLPKKNQFLTYKKKVLASGWGKLIEPKSSHSKDLKKVEIQILDLEICKSLYGVVNRLIHSKQLCTFTENHERKGACNGDSGGPLVMDRHVLVGISSWSRKDPDCASPVYPDVYTRVSEYIDWIYAHIK